jgi:hypothetical protein
VKDALKMQCMTLLGMVISLTLRNCEMVAYQ